MKVDLLETAFFASDADEALLPFYERLGASRRSEYELDGFSIVDLDWEEADFIVTLSDGILDQIRLLMDAKQMQTYKSMVKKEVKISFEQHLTDSKLFTLILRRA